MKEESAAALSFFAEKFRRINGIYHHRIYWKDSEVWRMKKRTKRILLVSGVAAGVAVTGAVSQGITEHLVRFAMDRDAPKIRNMKRARARLCGSDKMEAFLELREREGDRLEHSECETVEIVGSDGARLVGHWHLCEDAKRVIVAMHGWRSSWSRDFGIISEFWHNNGCSVLYVEQRGQNNSGGDHMGFGVLERHDCLDWIGWVNERCGEEMPSYLAGVSMGAATVLMASGLGLPSNVRGIIADCGFTSPRAIWKYVLERNLHLSYNIRSAAVDDLCRKRIKMDAGQCSTVDALKDNQVPVLFIHGTDDHFVPVEMTFENYKACVAPKRLLVVPGADHGMSYVMDREGYEAAFRDFWNTYD